MSDEQQSGMKKCPYCGRMTSAQANFCWWCARELSARPERPEPTPQKRPLRFSWVWVVLLAVVAIVVFYLLLR